MSQIIKTRVLATETAFTAVSAAVSIVTEPIRPYCNASVIFYDSNYVKVVPTAGSVSITYTAWVTDHENTVATNNVIDATNTHIVKWEDNCSKVTATPTGIVGAVYYKLRLVANAT